MAIPTTMARFEPYSSHYVPLAGEPTYTIINSPVSTGKGLSLPSYSTLMKTGITAASSSASRNKTKNILLEDILEPLSDLEDYCDDFYSDLSDDEPDDDTPEIKAPPSTPFWFGNEDSDHIRGIIASYHERLGLDSECRLRKRCPKPFIGRVSRMRVNSELGSEKLTTLDRVDIYSRDYRPVGFFFTVERREYFLTNWNLETGLPEQFIPQKCQLQLDYWAERAVKEERISFLYCLPVYCKSEFTYHVSAEEDQVGYSSVPLNKCFYKFLPKKYVSIGPRETNN